MELIDELNSYRNRQYNLDTLETRNLFTQLWADLKDNKISSEELENKLNYLKDNSHEGLFNELIVNQNGFHSATQNDMFDHLMLLLKFGTVPDIRVLVYQFYNLQISPLAKDFPAFFPNTREKEEKLKKIMHIFQYILENKQEYTYELMFQLCLKNIPTPIILNIISMIKNTEYIFSLLCMYGAHIELTDATIQYLKGRKIHIDINKVYHGNGNMYLYHKMNIIASMANSLYDDKRIAIMEKYIDEYIIDPTIKIQRSADDPSEMTMFDLLPSENMDRINIIKEKITHKYNISKLITENIPQPIAEEVMPDMQFQN